MSTPATLAEKAALNARFANPQPTSDRPDRTVPGGQFLLDQPPGIPAVWGAGTEVGWAQGEPLVIAGNVGAGKTTLAGQLVMARIGIHPGDVLGLPVTDDGGRLLYIAADRPRQIARALARHVHHDHRDRLNNRMVVWTGPLPFDVTANPGGLAELATTHQATTVVIDSVKDLGGVEKAEVGFAVNATFQTCVAADIEVLALHHQRKASGDNKRPTSLADLYGSVALGAGAGTVLLLWGQPGDPVVELTTLKPAADPLGPWKVIHDHDAGVSRVADRPDPLVILNAAIKGITARTMAQALGGKPEPSAAEVERARRQLERLVRNDLAVKQESDSASQKPSLYLPPTTTVI